MRSQSRAGFTLVELMVAMALTMFLMVILSQAFVIALDTFVGLKAIGDMQITLRTAKVLLSEDLGSDHLEGAHRLSDLTKNGNPRIVRQKPTAGFFAVLQGSTFLDADAATASPGPYIREGIDATTFGSFRATNHVLYMTVKRKGNRPENFFTTSLALPAAQPFFNAQTSYTMNTLTDLAPATYADPGFFNSQWAEVIYYLVPTGSTEEPNNPASTLGTPLFALMRAQFVMVTDSTNLNALPVGTLSASNFQSVSSNPTAGGGVAFFSPADAALGTGLRVVPSLGSLVGSSSGNLAIPARVLNGATMVLPNVTSFQIQVMPLGTTVFGDVPGGTFDSSLATNAIGLKGIQVTLRVFEYKTRQTRQMTIVQDL